MKDENNFTVSIDTNNDKLCRTVFGFGRFDDVELKNNSLADIQDDKRVYSHNINLIMGTCAVLDVVFYQTFITISTESNSLDSEVDNAIRNIKRLYGVKLTHCNDKLELFIPEFSEESEFIRKDIKFLFEQSYQNKNINMTIY